MVSDALSSTGSPSRVIEAIRAGRIQLVVSPALLDELNDVLERPKIKVRLDDEALGQLQEVLAAAPVTTNPTVVEPVSRDPNDDYLIALARWVDADCLVSGDGDLTSLVDIHPRVLTPAQLLQELAEPY